MSLLLIDIAVDETHLFFFIVLLVLTRGRG
jgi:hypothetical protein